MRGDQILGGTANIAVAGHYFLLPSASFVPKVLAKCNIAQRNGWFDVSLATGQGEIP